MSALYFIVIAALDRVGARVWGGGITMPGIGEKWNAEGRRWEIAEREKRWQEKNDRWSGLRIETPERTNKWLCEGCRDIMDFAHTHAHRNMIISRVSIRKRPGRNCFLWPACYRCALGLPGFSAPLLPSDKLSLNALFSIRARAREKGKLSQALSAWMCRSNPPHLFYLGD